MLSYISTSLIRNQPILLIPVWMWPNEEEMSQLCNCLVFVFGLVREVVLPSFIMVNLSTDSYFLPLVAVETESHLLEFLDQVLEGNIQVSPDSAGERWTKCFIICKICCLFLVAGSRRKWLRSVCQTLRLRHQSHTDSKSHHRWLLAIWLNASVTSVLSLCPSLCPVSLSVQPVFSQAPFLGCLLVCFPLCLVGVLCFLCHKARSTNRDDDDDGGAALTAASLQRHRQLAVKKSNW